MLYWLWPQPDGRFLHDFVTGLSPAGTWAGGHDTTRARRPNMTPNLWLELVVVLLKIVAASISR